MIKKIVPGVYQILADSCIYYLEEHKMLIDAGDRSHRQNIIQLLQKVVDFKDIKAVVFTHLHYDHIGNFDLFENARFYAHKLEIESFKKDPQGTILMPFMVDKFNVKLNELPSNINTLQVIHTPGHTVGSVCLWDEDNKILYSGDTFFGKKMVGRTDLPNSVPDKMQESIIKLISYNYKILCPGHNY